MGLRRERNEEKKRGLKQSEVMGNGEEGMKWRREGKEGRER